MRFLEEKFVPIAAKIGQEKHLVAIRDSFMTTMPLTILGALAVLVNNIGGVFSDTGLDIPAIANGWDSFITSTGIKTVCTNINNGTVNTLAVLIVVCVAYNLSKIKEANPLPAGVTAIAIYFALAPRTEGIQAAQLDAKGLFVAMIVGLLVGELFPLFAKNEKLRISMPEGVPPAVSSAFNTMIPAMLTATIWIAVGTAIETVAHANIWDLITQFVSAPLSNVADTLATTMIENLFVTVLWVFGIHGASIAGSITQPILYPLLQANTASFAANEEPAYTVVYLFRNVLCQTGGSGATLGLVIAILLFSKLQSERTIAKLGIACGIFEINEPITFGIPIVMNPVYAIPFIIGPVLCVTLSYFLTEMGLIGHIVLEIPWVTPPILNAFLATGGNFPAAIWSAVEIVLLTVLWTPFVIMSGRVSAKEAEG